jgi:hypothetical protein
MTRFKFLAVVLISGFAARAEAAFNLIGPGFGFVQVNPDNTPGNPPGNTTVATGLVNANNFYSWNTIGGDATPLASNSLTGLFTTQSTSIAAVTLVSNSAANPLLANPTALPVSGSSNLQRRTTGSSFSGDFSGNEALLFANAGNAALIIDFAVPVSAAGFRVQNVGFGTNSNFFLQAFNSNGNGFDPASPLYNNQSVTTSAFSPFSDTAPFYGISADGSDSFTRLWIGFNSNTPFAISTLEVTQAVITPVDPTAVPVPPTAFAGLIGVALVGIRRLRRKA